MATALFNACEGAIGELSSLLCAAAATAIRTGEERIDEAVLKQTEWVRPSERRAAVERMV
jgi:hypothetical protein